MSLILKTVAILQTEHRNQMKCFIVHLFHTTVNSLFFYICAENGKFLLLGMFASDQVYMLGRYIY